MLYGGLESAFVLLLFFVGQWITLIYARNQYLKVAEDDSKTNFR